MPPAADIELSFDPGVATGWFRAELAPGCTLIVSERYTHETRGDGVYFTLEPLDVTCSPSTECAALLELPGGLDCPPGLAPNTFRYQRLSDDRIRFSATSKIGDGTFCAEGQVLTATGVAR